MRRTCRRFTTSGPEAATGASPVLQRLRPVDEDVAVLADDPHGDEDQGAVGAVVQAAAHGRVHRADHVSLQCVSRGEGEAWQGRLMSLGVVLEGLAPGVRS